MLSVRRLGKMLVLQVQGIIGTILLLQAMPVPRARRQIMRSTESR